MYCPNCKETLTKNQKHAESVWQCLHCGGIFFIIVTTRPREDRVVLPVEAQSPEPCVCGEYVPAFLVEGAPCLNCGDSLN